MTRALTRARRDLRYQARLLLAARGVPPTEQALYGAALEAEHMHSVRKMAEATAALTKALLRR